MEYIYITLAIVGILSFFIGIYIVLRAIKSVTSPEKNDEKKDSEIATLKLQLEQSNTEKNEMAGKNKEMYARSIQMEADLRLRSKEKDELLLKLTKIEAQQEEYRRKQEEMIQKQHNAHEALVQERQRVIKEDEALKLAQEADRDRIWNEHEQSVLAQLRDLCKQPQFGFETYENTQLPESFHGTFKPDFLVAFLGQYIVFDAKVSKSGNMQTYINDQVKKTAQKVKGNQSIYNSIFLVIPHISLPEVKKTVFYEEGFNFFIVSAEVLPVILHSLKRIEHYELAEQLDPMERENIVDLIAQFDFHISSRNAVDVALMEHGIETLQRIKKIDKSMQQDIEQKKSKIRVLSLSPATQKSLTAHPEEVQNTLKNLIAPEAKIEQNTIPGFTTTTIE